MVDKIETITWDFQNESFNTQLVNTPIWKKVQEVKPKSLRSEDTVSRLALFMDQGRVAREVPIIDGVSGPVLEIIGLVDLVRFLPPGERLPRGYLKSKGHDLLKLEKEVTSFIESIRNVTIREAFSDIFLEREEKPLPCFTEKSQVRDIFQALIELHYQRHKYLTLPVIDNDGTGQKVRRMWSYIDGLKLIRDSKSVSPKVADFLRKPVDKICIKEVITLNKDNTLEFAYLKFRDLPFFPTHLPLRIEEGGMVEGVIDDILLNTLIHRIFLPYLSDMPLKEISAPFNLKDTVKLSDSIETLIEKLVDRPKQPITVMVGQPVSDDRLFRLEGIVNFVDIFKDFLQELDVSNQD